GEPELNRSNADDGSGRPVSADDEGHDLVEEEAKKEIYLEPDDEFLGFTTNPELEGAEYLDSLEDAPKPELPKLVTTVPEMIRDRIYLTGYDAKEHWTENHKNVVETEFCSGNRQQLFFYMSRKNELKLSYDVPRQYHDELNYFLYIPDPHRTNITPENFDIRVQYGSISGRGIESLLRIMSTIFAPAFFSNTTWPDSIRNDFALQLQRFMSALTDARWKLENKTVLYLPNENLDQSAEVAAKNKDLVNRFEMIVIHWTRQIKTVLNSQNTTDEVEGTGPLEEIEFWRNRCEDLTGISRQLDKPAVKHITDILTSAKSSYVAAFMRLADEIKFNTQQAQNNLKFLNTLKELCRQLSESSPKDIPPKLPRLINMIRMIWVNSKYYNSKEIITGLFRKLSNEIINRCCSVISLEDIFDGKVISSSVNLQHCIDCCEKYKAIYEKLQQMHSRNSSVPWDAQKNSIFAQVDAFIQRCRDLLEICECQKNFGRFEEGNKTTMPIFQGARGPEIEVLLNTIEQMFTKLMRHLYDKRGLILDVKATSWHDDYNRFRVGIKDLEVMMQNAINTAFETVTNVQQGVEILDVFAHLQTREAIRRTIDNKTHELVSRFGDCLNQVKKEMTQRIYAGLPIPTEATFSGQGLYWRFLRRRLERAAQNLDQAFFLPLNAAGIMEHRQQFSQTMGALEDLTRKTFLEFQAQIDPDPLKCLESSILIRSPAQSGLLEPNLNGSVLKLFNELHYWIRLGLEVPPSAAEAFRRRTELRYLLEVVLVVVRDYNRIMNSLNPEERALFRERIKILDKKIGPGLNKLHWTVKGLVDMFVSDCRIQASKLQMKVDEYKSANLSIKQNCEQIAQTLLIKLDPNRVYENTEFDDCQSEHRAVTRTKLLSLHEGVVEKMKEVKETFVSESADIQMYWGRYTERMDRYCEEAFRLNVKLSLSELQRAINGDGRNDPNPLFKVSLNLDNDVLVFLPTLPQLTNVVASLGSKFTEIISVVPRLPDLLTRGRSSKSPISEVIATDDEINKIQASIKRGMQEISSAVQEPLSYWDQFREIWELPKDDFIQRYRQLNPHVSSIDADIARYTEVTNKVQDAETMVTTRFLQLDFSLLKNAIAAHCRDWQLRLTQLLLDMTTDTLYGIYNYIETIQEKISRPPQNLDELGVSIQLLERILVEQHEIQAKFVPLEEQFAILDKCEVTYTEEVANKRANLANDWLQFQSALMAAEQMIKKSKEKFKTGLLADSEEFKRAVANLLAELQTSGPFAADLPPQIGLETVARFRDELSKLKERELELRHGLNLFKIEQPPCKEIAVIDKDLEYLDLIWTMNFEWENNWAIWKTGQFSELQTTDMENLANTVFRKFAKLARDLKERNWEVIEFSKSRIDQFRRTMPLIMDLRNPAMRQRHWSQLKTEMNKQFDENSEDFTLERIVQLGFEQFAELIHEISGAASKELAIEHTLDNMERAWQNIELDIVPHKEKNTFKIRSTEEIFQSLEDNQVQLSTMKASRFVKPFEVLVDRWERMLSHIMETIEQLLHVQRQYLYLETIFFGEDIRKQLPKESSAFDVINQDWKSITSFLFETKNARACATKHGLLEQLNKLVSSLEEIQQSLDMYLETKRQIFPRFYFIANDDLLEILGQGRNPEAVMPHMKKCFDNINTLRLEKVVPKTVDQFGRPVAAKMQLKRAVNEPHIGDRAEKSTAVTSDILTVPGGSSGGNVPSSKRAGVTSVQEAVNAQISNLNVAMIDAPQPGETGPGTARQKILSINNTSFMSKQESDSSVVIEIIGEEQGEDGSGIKATEEVAPELVKQETLKISTTQQARIQASADNPSISMSLLETNVKPNEGATHDEEVAPEPNAVPTQVPTTTIAALPVSTATTLSTTLAGQLSSTTPSGGKTKAHSSNVVMYDALSMFSLDGEEVPFRTKVRLDGPVESWLCDVEEQMYKTLRDLLRECRVALKKAAAKRDKFLKEWPGQLCITSSQIQWTADVTRALQLVGQRQDKKPLKSLRRKQRVLLEKFSETVRTNLTKVQRLKINGLVVIEVHQRDIIEKLYKVGCSDTNAFDWLSQLRFYWDKEPDDCFVRQTSTCFQYGYEYLGNSGRLVITPLTDRCYITLTTALHLHRGGSPKGPAGTGKTETVKDLGKALGDYVIVVNCSEGLDYKSMGRMFAGLAQTGAWGCFDEFNRINIEVLSVVAQQILSILSALALAAQSPNPLEKTRFMFDGRMLQLVWSCGIFITMNPGYAGRTELPDNLKSMFRPIAMVVPDSSMIAEITLFAEGFSTTKVLAKKVFTLYSLTVQQLSKQDHYDFGLRALVSVLRYAGRKKRSIPNMPDEEVLLLSLNDMNLAKLTSVDLPLFKGIMSDLFPGIEAPAVDYTKIKNAVEGICKEMNLQVIPFTLSKVVQLYETKSSRHSVMIVGKTLSGKSTTWRILQAVHNELAKTENSGFEKVHDYALNPKSLSLGELYGEFDLSSNEWSDGVLSSLMRQHCADESPILKWIIFDGPVDTLWIESMNSVMDDNKILTLINGERISMPEQVSLLFEVEDLSVASPATVSRCGMVFNDVNDLGWWPFVNSWLAAKTDKVWSDETKRLFDKYVEKLHTFVRQNCTTLIPLSETNTVISLCRLYDSLATPDAWADPSDQDYYPRLLEMTFQFCMTWSICSIVDQDGRKKVDAFIREVESGYPNKDTIYEYFVDPKARSWVHWEEKLRSGWKYGSNEPFYKILVPTVDTVRYHFLANQMVERHQPVLLMGPVGTGKTSLAVNVLNSLDQQEWSNLTINMSAQTTSNNVQEIIEARVEKRTKDTYVPMGGTKMLTFMDDFNMPAKDSFGSQPPLELIRQWIDYGFWYDRSKQTIRRINGMHLLVAMGPPGGGRTVISKRLQSRFNQLVITFPTEANLKRIYGTLLNQKLQDFEDEVKSMAENLLQASIYLYGSVVTKFLPTPTKIHYLFNLRDISKIFQGLLRANKSHIETRNIMLRLWIHEGLRVFGDRLVNDKDRGTYVDLVGDALATYFDQTYHSLCPARQAPIFADFLNADLVYEDIVELDRLRRFMTDTLREYNETPGTVAVDLVLFRDAIEHTCKITRVINQPRGNMLLIGIGGSGRQSLSRLAAYICEYRTFQIEVTKHYRKQEFREDLKQMYWQAGVENKPTLFLFTDTQVVEESFLEDINNMLSSGEVPTLYKTDEFEEVRQAIEQEARQDGARDSAQGIFQYFIDRVRANLHIVLCMSPIGEPFRNRIRMFPAFVNCTTIDWFSEWPMEALLEVADRYLSEVILVVNEPDPQLLAKKQDKIHASVAKIFATMHRSVSDMALIMFAELRRQIYVTPTNYLELVSGYKSLLYQKRQELSDKANKLTNGLGKIDETREKVEIMSIELEETRKKVASFQKECDDFLVIIVQQKREADEQAKSVMQTQEKIKVDEAKCMHMAELAMADLAQAMPALEAAVQALEALNKKDISEIKSYGKPPYLVQKVMEAVMILRGSEPTWTEAKRQLGDQDFIKQLVNFDKDNINDRTLKKIGQYCAQDDFHPDVVGKVSSAAKSLCMWVRAIDVYGRVYRVVEPKRQRLQQAEAVLREKQELLAQAQAKLDEINAEIRRLQEQYNDKMQQKEELRKSAEHTEKMLDRASKLVSGLAGEKNRWEITVADLLRRIELLPGDCLLAAAFLSYMGPFLSEYREKLVKNWFGLIRAEVVPASDPFVFTDFLADPTQVRQWNLQGLPRDGFSVENGVIVTRGARWPLMVDPQGQAQRWIKSMEGKALLLIDLQMADYMRVLELAIQHGSPVLLQNVQEKLDQALDPVLNKSLIKVGGIMIMKLGDKEVEYNNDFRFYITTKLPNPHYAPEISSKTAIVNFAVKLQGLEAQLLGNVVRKERPELEEQKDNLVIGIASGKRKLAELEDEILRLLNEAQGSLLDDEQLVNTLQTSKVTSTEVTEQLQVAEKTEIQIDAAREGYRPCAQRASILFFVLNDLGRIDPMYQFALDAYIDLFNMSIDKSPRSGKLDDRIVHLNDYHTYAVYRYTCRGLFERHKLLFSFQICIKILEASGKLNQDEYNFFLRGGIVLDRENQFDNPCSSWLSELCWDNITELEKLANFHGLVTSFEQYGRDWNIWFTSAEPENSGLPGEWDNTLNEFQRMLIVRSLRPDRVSYCATSFITSNLGSRFVEPPVLDMKQVVEDSTTRTPLIFVLSTGVDPTTGLLQLAENCGMGKKFNALSLGQGQAPIATRLIWEGIQEGNWVFLANCHLSLSWMPQLDKIVEQLGLEKETHPEFRLWLSSSPNPAFPISILQAGIKMTTEPPKGIRSNMKRLYHLIKEEQFTACHKPEKYKKLLFCLCFFHSILLERRKFLMLGWNIPYEFNDSDFEVSEHLLTNYLDQYEETAWEALRYLIADINYGGHVTDDWDRRLLGTYIGEYFKDDVLKEPFYKLSILPHYYVPRDGTLNAYREFVSMLPQIDHPEAFGQHPNADITSQIQETRMLLDTLLSLQPQVSSASGVSREDKVLELIDNLQKQLPENIDYEGTAKIFANDSSPLVVVLLQEIQRYNALIDLIRTQLSDLSKGIQGLVVMSSELEAVFTAIFDNHVPEHWSRTYSSLKPLGSWSRDLSARVDLFAKWAHTAHAPKTYWIGAFTFPTGFLTAVLQTSARQNNVSVDSLSWEFTVQNTNDSNLLPTPKDGVYVCNLYLQGAGWDKKSTCLIEATPMQLVCPMPIVHFRPMENKKKSMKNIYVAPCYYYPNRAGTPDRPSFMIGVELKTGDKPPEHWIKRSTALLMSLDT
ncbi:Dynein heavy chain axonemal, partial [Fasciolopsis buskii]